MSTYTFSTSPITYMSDFQSYLGSPSPTAISYDGGSGVLSLTFASALSSPQQLTLSNLVNAYTNPSSLSVPYINDSVTVSNYIAKTNTYAIMCLFIWNPPVEPSVYLSGVQVVTSLVTPTPGGANNTYKLRVYDFTNNKVIVESSNLSQTNYAIVNLAPEVNLPVSSSIFELQALVNYPSTDSLNVKSCNFVYSQRI